MDLSVGTPGLRKMCQIVLYTGSFQIISCSGPSDTFGKLTFSRRNHSSACRALPNSVTFANT